jgi:hypothetical protein
MEFEGGNVIYLRTPEAAHAINCDFLFIDEAAFVHEMEEHWRAMFPTISTGSKVLVLSTPNGKSGWFYDTYKEAIIPDNADWYVFYSSHLEYPEYNQPAWQSCSKKNLGIRGYRQEVLQQFLDADRDYAEETYSKIDVTKKEEDELIEKATERAEEGQSFLKQQRDFCKLKNRELAEKVVAEDIPTGKVLYEDDPEYNVAQDLAEGAKFEEFVKQPEVRAKMFTKKEAEDHFHIQEDLEPVESPEDWKEPPHVDEFKLQQMKWEQIHDFFQKAHEGYEEDEDFHPLFDEQHREFDGNEGMAMFYEALADGEESADSRYFRKKARKIEAAQTKMENRINAYEFSDDILVLCGLMDAKECKGNTSFRPDLRILHKVTRDESLPDEMNLLFLEGRLCVNEVPTNIREEDLCDCYNGLMALKSHEEAEKEVVSIIRKKLQGLFGKEVENDDKASVCE